MYLAEYESLAGNLNLNVNYINLNPKIEALIDTFKDINLNKNIEEA